ncbi:MAG: hypothetical protein WC607_04170 [Candidatus Micrarchaeia archaeon]
MVQPTTGTPLFVAVPSVRPCVTSTLSRWMLHALQARTTPENRPAVIKALEKEAEAQSGEVKRRLTQVANWMQQGKAKTRDWEPNPRGKSSGGFQEVRAGDIHFVIVDNNPFYRGQVKSERVESDAARGFEKSHSPIIQAWTEAFNRVGNDYGVFVHHMNPKHLAHDVFNRKEFSHTTPKGTRRFGTGGAQNASLCYARTLTNGGPALWVEVDDDILPANLKKYLKFNAFTEMEDHLVINRPDYSFLGGYDWGSRKPRRLLDEEFQPKFSYNSSQIVFGNSGRFNLLPTKNHECESIKFIGERLFASPTVLHAGGRTTLACTSPNFGGAVNMGVKAIELPTELMSSVRLESGISRPRMRR